MVRTMIMRGGTSKGLYLLESDLPQDLQKRDALILELMGSPDPRQIDGLGGAHPLTSKVAVVGSSDRDDADIDYLFLQVGVEQALVTDRQNCGNLLAGVGPFAVERGLVSTPSHGEAAVRIHMRNSGDIAQASFAVSNGKPVYDGNTAISGVPGSAAPIRLDFKREEPSLPTGSASDSISGIDVTLVDAGMPTVVINAASIGLRGDEECSELENDDELRGTLERLRLAAGPMMSLGDVSKTTVPKLTIVSAPRHDGHLTTRTFIPHRCHDAIGVLGAMSVAVAARTPHSVAVAVAEPGDSEVVRLEHPTGHLDATVSFGADSTLRTGIIRTARPIMDGIAFPRPS